MLPFDIPPVSRASRARSSAPPLPQRCILLTALDIARGLEYLHHPERRLVHRDLSANNVLLSAQAGDERGFQALLSDFGAPALLFRLVLHCKLHALLIVAVCTRCGVCAVPGPVLWGAG